jgi:hypothetical protein
MVPLEWNHRANVHAEGLFPGSQRGADDAEPAAADAERADAEPAPADAEPAAADAEPAPADAEPAPADASATSKNHQGRWPRRTNGLGSRCQRFG